jgi:hypothetical protein
MDGSKIRIVERIVRKRWTREPARLAACLLGI